MWYCSGESSARHSASLFSILLVMATAYADPDRTDVARPDAILRLAAPSKGDDPDPPFRRAAAGRPAARRLPAARAGADTPADPDAQSFPDPHRRPADAHAAPHLGADPRSGGRAFLHRG